MEQRRVDEVGQGVQRSLTSVLAVAAIPYGLTIVISSDLLILRAYRGFPSVPEVFAFALGAIAGYVGLAVLGGTDARAEAEPFRGSHMIRVGTMHIVGVGAVLGLAVASAQIPSWFAWTATAFITVSGYIALSAVSFLVVGRFSRRRVVSESSSPDANAPAMIESSG